MRKCMGMCVWEKKNARNRLVRVFCEGVLEVRNQNWSETSSKRAENFEFDVPQIFTVSESR